MALNLLVSGKETTDRTEVILTDVTSDWGSEGNMEFSDVLYAEMYVGIKGALYGPVILTSVFANATVQSDLVFTITPELLGLDQEFFDDAIHEYHYGVSDVAVPETIQRDIWDLQTVYSIPTIDTQNKIPFSVVGSAAIRTYNLSLVIMLDEDDKAVNPRVTLKVNYQDGTFDQVEQIIPQDSTSHLYSLIIDVDRAKEILSVTGYLLNEDRTVTNGRLAEITNVSLNEGDLDLLSNVLRALVSEKTKSQLDRDFIKLQDDLLCGNTAFVRHEELIIRDLAFNSVTNAAKQGLSERAESIIDYLNEDC